MTRRGDWALERLSVPAPANLSSVAANNSKTQLHNRAGGFPSLASLRWGQA